MSDGASSSNKTCLLCGRDCSAIPRVKDNQGRYSCKTCFDAASAKKAAKAQDPPAAPAGPAPARKSAEPRPAAAPAKAPKPTVQVASVDPATQDDDAMMAALFDSPSSGAVAAGDPCPECGAPGPAGQQICLHCGYNRSTGKTMKVKVSRETGAAATTAKVGKALIMANPLVWAVGGIVGGAIGAVLWAVVAVALNREIGWIAWGVGVMTGVGVRVLAGRYAGLISGVLAAVIAIVAVLAGKFATASILVEEFAQQAKTAQTSPQSSGQSSGKSGSGFEPIKITDQDIMDQMAVETAERMQKDGLTLYWPKGKDFDTAETLYDYPQDVRDEVNRTWRRATPDWKAKKRAEMEKQLADLRAEITTDIVEHQDETTEAVFTHSFGPLDIVFLILAIASAYSVGSGAGGGGGDDD